MPVQIYIFAVASYPIELVIFNEKLEEITFYKIHKS